MKKSLILLAAIIGIAGAFVIIIGQISYASDRLETKVVPTYMFLQGSAIAGLWVKDLASGKLEGGFFKAKENGLLYWPHVSAELLTAGGLITGAYGLYAEQDWGRDAALVSLGALGYTSLNSLNWALAEEERYPYAVPMIIGLTGSGISISILF